MLQPFKEAQYSWIILPNKDTHTHTAATANEKVLKQSAVRCTRLLSLLDSKLGACYRSVALCTLNKVVGMMIRLPVPVKYTERCNCEPERAAAESLVWLALVGPKAGEVEDSLGNRRLGHLGPLLRELALHTIIHFNKERLQWESAPARTTNF